MQKEYDEYNEKSNNLIKIFNEKYVTNPKYNILTNNCSQKCLELIDTGVLQDGTKVSDFINSNKYVNENKILPLSMKKYMQEVFYNNSFKKK